MKKVFKGLDTAIGFLYTHVGGLWIAGTFILVLYAILCRYVLHVNTGGLDEFSTYFVTCSVWTGAVLCSRNLNDGQVRIDFLATLVKDKRAMTFVNMFWELISIAVQAIFTVLSFNYCMSQLRRGATLSGLDFPISFFTGVMTICSAFITIYEVRRFVVLALSLRNKESEKEENA